jgi:hypothetical protein
MDINLHNYETYFLLLIDNELSIAEQQAVACFVAEHPALAEELNLLKETKLKDGDIELYNGKEALLKSTAKGINEDNYEAYLLNYIDDELTEDEQHKLLKYVEAHPAIKEDLQILQQTVLTKEVIVFSNKNSLYRKEKSVKPVVFIGWKQMRIAAIVAGIILLSINLIKKDSTVVFEKTVAHQKSNHRSNANKNIALASSSDNHNKKDINNIEQSIPKQQVAQNELINVNSNSPLYIKKAEEIIEVDNEIIKGNTPPILASEIHVADLKSSNVLGLIMDADSVNASANNNSLTEIEAYKELNTNERDNSLYIGSLIINKDKFRGLVRKASAFLKIHSRQDELEIAPDK